MNPVVDDRKILAREFANEWLEVAMNDHKTYLELMSEAKDMNTIELADKLKNDWETLAEQVTDLVEEHISEIASLFVGQWLKGQGTLPFDLIARQVKNKHEEIEK